MKLVSAIGNQPETVWRSGRRVIGRRGFTLLEMLIVVSIILVLAAILVPVAGRMKRAAQTTASISNLRQIHLMMLNYLNDHNGEYPLSVDQSPKDPPLGYETTWRRMIWESSNDPFPSDSMTAMKNSAYSKVMWCPLLVGRYGQIQHPAGQGSYSLNRFFEPPGWRYTPRPGAEYRRVNMPEIVGKKEPYIMAGTPLASDRRIGTFYHNDSSKFPYDTAWSNLAYEYGSSGNMALGLFIDGHVQALTKQEGIALDQALGDATTLE